MPRRGATEWEAVTMKLTCRFNTRTLIALAVVCAGGLLPGTCAIRSRQAFIDGSKSFLTNVLLNPANIVDLPFDELAGGDTDTN